MVRLLILVAFIASAEASAQTYFQQQVNFLINVELDDSAHSLTANETVQYKNNSPDTLHFIYFHLWPNAYRNTKTALAKQLKNTGKSSMLFASEEELGLIDSLDFKINGLRCLWEFDSLHIDICIVYLEKPLLPSETVEITTPFFVKLPSGSISRLGHIGQSYQITQWYPKPAVYDQNGWHPMPYLSIGEFFSEYGTFDVHITLPENYTVGATGDLMTIGESKRLDDLAIETEKWLDERKLKADWSEVSKDLAHPESSKTLKTLHFHQEKIHDFGWFADKRYHVLKDNVRLPGTKDSVTVWTMFTNKKAVLWQYSPEYMSDAIYYYSLWNGNYPYKQATAVDGTISAGGGMEYPNVTVIGDASSDLELETVIMHEVGHNWFYGILGSNERDHAWLDEGVNSYNEQRYLSTKYPEGILFSKKPKSNWYHFAGFDDYALKDQHYFGYLVMARSNRDQALNLSSPSYSELNYGLVVYAKSAVFLNYLRSYLGDSLMDAGMHRYFDQYKFQHPTPDDLYFALESASSKDLRWFFDDVINSNYKLDYTIKKVKVTDRSTEVKLRNKGRLSSPVSVSILRQDSVLAEKWISGFDRDTTIHLDAMGDLVMIDRNRVMPELYRDNNYTRTSGLLRRVEPISFKFAGSIEKPWKNQVFYLPLFALNNPNGFMPALLLYNTTLPTRKFTYYLLPMFSLKTFELGGVALMNYSFTPESSSFESIDFSISAKRFVYAQISQPLSYSHIVPAVTFYFKPPKYSGLYTHNMKFSSAINVVETTNIDVTGTLTVSNQTNLFNRFAYQFDYGHPIYNTSGSFMLEEHKEFIRASLELNEKIDFDWKVIQYLRFFAGAFLLNTSTNPAYNWRMDGQNFITDYGYDAQILDRSGSDAELSRQMVLSHGAFKVPTAVGQSNLWLMAVNYSIRMKKLPIGLFVDAGTDASLSFEYDAGVYIPLLSNVIELYFPLVYSKNISSAISANALVWHDLIRFQCDINRINPVEMIKRFEIP